MTTLPPEIILDPEKPIIAVGDIHGQFSRFLQHLKYKCPKAVQILHVGDFGIGFDREYENAWLGTVDDLLGQMDSTLHVLRGNHDDPSRFGTGESGHANITLLADYQVLRLGTQQGAQGILCVGGAVSIDRKQRTAGSNWWEGESFEYHPDLLSGLTGIRCVLTHTAPESSWPFGFNSLVHSFADRDPGLLPALTLERAQMECMLDILEKGNPSLDRWVYGHFHQHMDTVCRNVRFTALAEHEWMELVLR